MSAIPTPTLVAREKLARLEDLLRGYGRIIVAYSGGVDSTFLSVVAHRTLNGNALAVTAHSESLAPEELVAAQALAQQFGFAHRVVRTDELRDPQYAANPVNRCYFCKTALMDKLEQIASAWKAKVALGAILDDLGDFRPGENAALERGAVFPLREVGLTKIEIRALSRDLGLPTADKPAAACLSSRIPFGQPVTAQKLEQIAKGEALLHNLDFRECRLRHHENVARIEVPSADVLRLLEHRDHLVRELKALGFVFVTVDLQGLRSGSLHEAVQRVP